MMKANKHGFTMIEILASMGVLLIIVLMVANMYNQASKAWLTGEKQVFTYDVARGAMDELTVDMAATIADDLLPFAHLDNRAFETNGVQRVPGSPQAPLLSECDAVYFVSAALPRDSMTSGIRDLAEICYFVELDPGTGRGRLVRHIRSLSTTMAGGNVILNYQGGSLATQAALFIAPFTVNLRGVMLENVYSFVVRCNTPAAFDVADFYSLSVAPISLPSTVDVELAVLTDPQWAMAESLSTSDWHNYAVSNALRVAFTVSFPTARR